MSIEYNGKCPSIHYSLELEFLDRLTTKKNLLHIDSERGGS
jgi:hypothetical protein